MDEGVVSDEIIDQVHINRFKRIFGNDVDVVKLRAKFKYSATTCGSCVRDLLLENIPFYLNIAMSCTRSVIKEYLAEAFHGQVKYNCEIRHGITTQCVRNLNGKVDLVSSAIPRDVSIHHTINWKLNRSRRIFHVKAMVLSYDGKVYNYFNTHDELLKTLEETDSRIKDDHLRILRYLRIVGRITNGNYIPDDRTLHIMKSNISGLENIPGHQIWNEMRIILQEHMRVKSLIMIFECGGFKYIGLPENGENFDEFAYVSQNSIFGRHPLLAITYLCAFLNTLEEVLKLHQRLKLSAYERDLACFLVSNKAITRYIDDFDYYEQMCLQPIKGNKNITKEYVLELLKYNNKPDLFNQLMLWC